MVDRIIGVLKMDVPTFEAIEHDEAATTQAAIIVTVVAVIAAIGSYFTAGAASAFISNIEGLDPNLTGSFAAALSPVGSAVSSFVSTYVAWILWSFATYFIGTNFFGGQATVGEMMRVIGFSMAPRVLSFIPCVNFFAWIYSLVLGFIGVRQGLDLDNSKTAITIVLSFIAVLIANFIVGLIMAPIFAIAG